MSIVDGILNAIVPPLIALRVTEYTIVACGGLLVYEYFLTLDREVYYVWGSKWSVGKIIFILNRYSPVVDTVLAMYTLTGVKDPNSCPLLTSATAWTFMAGMYISEIILAMRTYAIWGARRSILVFLVSFTLVVFASGIVLMWRFLNALTFVQIPPFLESLGLGIACAPVSAPGKVPFEFLVFMVNQAVIATLTLYRGLRQYRASQNPMVMTMFHDGLLYYIYTLVLSIVNVAVALAAPVQYGVVLELPLRVVNSICCTRVLLNIRGAYFTPNEPSHDGATGEEKQSSFGWGSLSRTSGTASTTAAPSDSERSGERRNSGWTWGDGVLHPSTRLSLRPISPFQCDIPDVV